MGGLPNSIGQASKMQNFACWELPAEPCALHAFLDLSNFL